MKLFDIFRGKGREDELTYTDLLERGDYVAAIPLLRDALRKEDAEAMGLLATLQTLGRGVEKNLEESALWYRQAAVRGHVPSQAPPWAICLAAGIGMPPESQKAVHWFYKTARSGHGKSTIGLGDLIFQNRSLLDLGLFSAREVNDLVLAARQAGRAGAGS